VTTKKLAKFYKMANCVFSWPAHLKNGRQIFPKPDNPYYNNKL